MEIALTIGVKPASGFITSADDAALRVASLAETAALSKTFGVGGLLIDKRGHVLAEAVNAVIRNGIVSDPTAHVERQLVDWYFISRSERRLPPPEELVIISSLDPCAMCAGAILQSGLSLLAVAEDPVSGVHDEHRLPHRMPQEIWAIAEEHLVMIPRQGQHSLSLHKIALPLKGTVSAEALGRCQAALTESITRVRSQVGGSPDGIPEADFITTMDALRSVAAELPLGTYIAPANFAGAATTNAAAISKLLGDDGACLIDECGRPILFARSAEAASPIRDSILELIRAYSILRNWMRETRELILPRPRACSVLSRRAPESPISALLDLGALGSFLEEHRYPNPFPLLTFVEEADDRVQRYAASLPPFYTEEIGLTVGQLRSELFVPC